MGISLEFVQRMLNAVRNSPALVLPQTFSIHSIDKMGQVIEAGTWKDVAVVLDGTALISQYKPLEVSTEHIEKNENAKVIVIADHSNWESVATALVLVKSVAP